MQEEKLIYEVPTIMELDTRLACKGADDSGEGGMSTPDPGDNWD